MRTEPQFRDDIDTGMEDFIYQQSDENIPPEIEDYETMNEFDEAYVAYKRRQEDIEYAKTFNALDELTEDLPKLSKEDQIIQDRDRQYGSYRKNVEAITSILNVLRDLQEPKGDAYCSPEDVENFFLVLKLVRLQRATDEDSLIDLQNYARLARERRFHL